MWTNILFILSIAYLVSAISQKECEDKENEELSVWLNDGYPCGNTCENYKVPCDVMLPMVLVWSPHCVCKKGFSRLPSGKCVPIEDPECEELYKPSVDHCLRRGNEIYDTASACQMTCKDLASNEPKACIMSLVEDCYCPEGMVRYVEHGRCVPKESCPVQWLKKSPKSF
ncbi:hypothetical protein Bhyg_00773 [Pseudolycoriella hygida]|uniref:TIL domain-containing protein n=1 Tax=Pseudolycoriella hygida TaxID=35572 RepID=A0A9Q0N914_9DIPT|nr:hypothetical protein Bhyg_00773 [Pseudolycoriella hygida]